MKTNARDLFPSRSLQVLAAIALVVVLAGLLAARTLALGGDGATVPKRPVASMAPPAAPAATVPLPPAPPEAPEVPCWGCPQNGSWSLSFKTDLDLLAPLGDGEANAALWFRDFARATGVRAAEGIEAMERRVKHSSGLNVLPATDPLLLEAEPWVDQATMQFYPDAIPVTGWNTEIPNLLLAITFAKSWTARGHDAVDDEAALADYRRTIRLGRLLRQEDTVLITDLVGLACIRYGVQGIYDLAIRRGDRDLALLASIVLGEYAPQRLLTSERVTTVDVGDRIRESWWGGLSLDITDADVEGLIERAVDNPDRRFRMEALLALNTVRHLGSGAQRERAHRILDETAASDDPIMATMAVWCRDVEFTEEDIETMRGH